LRRNSDPKKAARADLIEFSLSCEAIRKLQKEFVPEKLQKADKQNRERHLARIKIVKQLINAETESRTSARSTSSNPTPNTDTNTPEPFFLDDIHEEEIDEISDREQAYQKRKRFVYRKSTNNFFSEYKEQALRIDPNINPDVFLLPASLPMCFSHDGCGPDFHGIMDSLGIDIVENGYEDKDEDEDKIAEGHTSRRNRA
jgi:hypothetical protein